MTGILTGESTAMLGALSLSAGIALGVLYDIFRIRRTAVRMSQSKSLNGKAAGGIKSKTDGDETAGEAETVDKALKSDAAETTSRRFVFISAEKTEECVIFIEDIIFSLVSAVLFSVLFYRFSWGAVRWYALAFALIGFAAYRVTVGRAVMACAGAIIGLILRIVRFIKRLVGKIAYAAVNIILRRIVRPLEKAGRIILDTVLYPYYLRRSERLKKRVAEMAENGFEECRTDNFIKRWIRAKKEKKTKSRPIHSG